MPNFEIIKPGLMTSIQDLGRKGLGYFAIPRSGVMDRNAARIALLILNKNENSPLLECTSVAPQIQFHAATEIVITGANFNWTLNGEKIFRNTILKIGKSDLLKGQFAQDGLRGYIAFRGELKLEKTYDSYSTYTNAKIGGFEGRLLQKGDIIEWENTETVFSKIEILPIRRGPEFHFLTDFSKKNMAQNIYKIGKDSNRMGVRLEGKPLEAVAFQLENSSPVLPGFVQLPPSGLPIIVLQDGQTTGGYPRIAYLQEKYLSPLNQIVLGGELQFRWE